MFEKVNAGHPDKMADRLAGAVVDLVYERAGILTFERSRQTGSGVSLRAKENTKGIQYSGALLYFEHELHELNE